MEKTTCALPQAPAGSPAAGRLLFLGTGAAWRLPELGCPCAICREMRARGESRMRTSLWFDGPLSIMVDCGPDAAEQLDRANLGPPDVLLLTHEHGDHYLGLDELEAFRRREPVGGFTPIPTYAHPRAWETIRVRFEYLFGKVIDPREAVPGRPLEGLPGEGVCITPFKTNHGPMPRGSVGYVWEAETGGRRRKLAYTSDFLDLPEEPAFLVEPDLLVAQTHWFNEPAQNIPYHMSLQRLVPFIRQWRPRERVFLVHISDGDVVEGDGTCALKKRPAAEPLSDPRDGHPYPVPRCQEEWQRAAEAVFTDHGLTVPVTVARDGLSIPL